MNSADQIRFANLLTWGREHGATLHDNVEVYKDDVTGFSLRVKESAPPEGLPPGFTAVTCPASATLSYLNAINGGNPLPANKPTHQPVFPDTFTGGLPPHVVGRFFLIQQYLLGEDSYWAPYIAALPQPEHLASWALPAFWPEEDTDFLEGTNAYVAVEEIQANLKREFKAARKVLKECGFEGWQDYSRLLYNWAFAMFTSRSFRPATVLSAAAMEVTGEALRLRERGVGWEDFSVLMPVFDLANHDPRAAVEWHRHGTDKGSCDLEILGGCHAGEQVFNNYGRKTNAELLLGYRFILPEREDFHNDYVHVRKRGDMGHGSLTGQDNAGGDAKPKDFLISLRPMLDESSLVGRARQQVKPGNGEKLDILPEFSHVEDGLIWDLAVNIATQDEDAAKLLESGLNLARILASPTEPQLVDLLDKIKNSLLAKLYDDYETLSDVEVDDETGEARLVPQNANQELAYAYRKQCEKVLVTALRTLTPGSREFLPSQT